MKQSLFARLRTRRSILRNQRGQGLVEYLIIVALMGVASIAIMRVFSEAVQVKFAQATAALQPEARGPSIKSVRFSESDYKKKDLGNFFSGASSHGTNSDSRGD